MGDARDGAAEGAPAEEARAALALLSMLASSAPATVLDNLPTLLRVRSIPTDARSSPAGFTLTGGTTAGTAGITSEHCTHSVRHETPCLIACSIANRIPCRRYARGAAFHHCFRGRRDGQGLCICRLALAQLVQMAL